MKTVEYLTKQYVIEGTVGAPEGAIFLDSLSSDDLVALRNILTSSMDLGRSIKMFQSKAKGIKLVEALLAQWDIVDFNDESPAEMAPVNDLPTEPTEAPTEPAAGWASEAPTEPTEAPTEPAAAPDEAATQVIKVRDGSKQAALIDLLKRPEGASIKEIAETLNWVNHTVRGAISRDLKKRLGLPVTKSRIEGRGQVYRIEG